MKIVRATKNLDHIMSGKGPAYSKIPGRWNILNQEILYCGTEFSVAFSEVGYYSLMARASLGFYLDQINKANATNRTYQKLSEPIGFYLGEIELSDKARLLDITDQKNP